MFDNRIEINSPGELLRPLTVENLENLDYKPKSRNKTIVDVFLRRKLMDKRGSGILRMKEATKKWKLPEPRFEENTGYFVIKFTGPYQETVVKTSEKILRLIKERPSNSAKNIAAIAGITPRAVEMQIATLKQKGIIKRIGPAKGGY
ncbi:MAG: ATP-binding protein [Nanoarchaeota archaeon]